MAKLDQLPVEVRGRILICLDRRTSLSNAVLASPCFYLAFGQFKKDILESIYLSQAVRLLQAGPRLWNFQKIAIAQLVSMLNSRNAWEHDEALYAGKAACVAVGRRPGNARLLSFAVCLADCLVASGRSSEAVHFLNALSPLGRMMPKYGEEVVGILGSSTTGEQGS